MKSSRRDFLKYAGSFSMLGWTAMGYASAVDFKESVEETAARYKGRKQVFNMSGYAAPAIPNLRVGYIGLGNRGYASLQRLAQMEGVEIRAISDVYEYPIKRAQSLLKGKGCPAPAEYYSSRESWKDLCARDDLDLIYVMTPPFYHAEMVIGVMESGKHAATEVSAAQRLEDCWKMVVVSEKTRKHCFMLENCCYDFFESMTINMALQGIFGDIIHGEGAYIHNSGSYGKLFQEPMPPLSKESAPWYGAVLSMARGNRYPTHGFGPVCQAMKINCGDRLDYLTSVETDDFIRARTADELAATGNPYHQQFKNKIYSGNMNCTMIRTVRGKSILVQYDTVDPRPYSRIHLLSGTRGFVQKYPLPGRIYEGHREYKEDEMKEIEKKYTPELISHLKENAVKFGGHGGMDFIIDWRLVDCLRNGLPLDISVYDAALWSSITPLSAWSVMNRSNSIDVPDFTCGGWEVNKPVNLSLKGGGTTKMTREVQRKQV